jgi:hypothetical protein
VGLDRVGTVRWEKLNPGGCGNVENSVLITKSQNIICVPPCYCNGIWAYVFNSQGDFVKKQWILENAGTHYTLAHSTPQGNTFGLFVTTETGSSVLLTLNEQLETIRRDTPELGRFRDREPGFCRTAYLLPDQSVAVFGGRLRGQDSDARIMRFDKNIRAREKMYPAPQGTSNIIWAAVPLDKPGEFAVVRDVNRPYKTANSDPAIGIALDFLTLSH